MEFPGREGKEKDGHFYPRSIGKRNTVVPELNNGHG